MRFPLSPAGCLVLKAWQEASPGSHCLPKYGSMEDCPGAARWRRWSHVAQGRALRASILSPGLSREDAAGQHPRGHASPGIASICEESAALMTGPGPPGQHPLGLGWVQGREAVRYTGRDERAESALPGRWQTWRRKASCEQEVLCAGVVILVPRSSRGGSGATGVGERHLPLSQGL